MFSISRVLCGHSKLDLMKHLYISLFLITKLDLILKIKNFKNQRDEDYDFFYF